MPIGSAIMRARRLRGSTLAPVVLFQNHPEAVRLGYDLTERMALIAGELFEAFEGETIKAFYDRLCAIARERKVVIVSVGSDEPVKVSRYNMDGSPVTLN